jgi:hypothetical protein
MGQGCLYSLSSGSYNCGYGRDAGVGLLTGSYNLYFGDLAGQNHNGAESSCIYHNSPGVLGESNCLRIGAGSGTGNQQLSTAFISGINGNTIGGTPLVVTIDSSTDQLGVAAFPTGALSWVNVTSGTQAIVASTGYVTDNATQVTYTLPTSPAFGNIFKITGGVSGAATAPWTIAQNAGQQINFGNYSTTVGTGGSLTATLKYDSVELVCVVAGASAVWNVLSSVGNITVV